MLPHFRLISCPGREPARRRLFIVGSRIPPAHYGKPVVLQPLRLSRSVGRFPQAGRINYRTTRESVRAWGHGP